MPKTIIVSNRLPIKIQREEDKLSYKPSEGGLATGLGSIYKEGDNIWIGWPGLAIQKTKEKEEIVERLTEENMKPVFLNTSEIEDFYEGFSNETLWPNFHYFNQYAVYEEHLWLAYKKVNRKFAKAIEEVLEEGDTLWIHDYQLLLLPQMVRDINAQTSIGFFLHIPFPSFESFRLLPWRRELLNGMMGADFLGFHTYDDMRHFLSSVNRLAGIGNSNGQINVGNRPVLADALPMGIDYDKYASAAALPDTLDREVRYRTSLGDVKLILTIDRLDYSKGIPQRLLAFEQFLEENEDFQGKVSLLMVVVPSRDKVPKYAQLKEEIDLLVGRINGRFGKMNWMPIHYFYRSFPLNALSAFYRMAHVALVTPMRDGMNLVCKEFIASKLDKKGVLILSEMAGASKELSDAILINPNDIRQLVAAIKEALTMPEDEQQRRMHIMQESLKRYNIHAWVNLFMKRLAFIKKEQENLQTKPLDKNILELLKEKYKGAKKRIIFLDYDGTLVGFFKDPNDSKPDTELKEILEKLTKDPKNKVVVISGRDRQTLGGWMEKYPVDVIAEHGVWYKKCKEEWAQLVQVDNTWKDDFLEVLEMYVDRTPGSFVEEKDYSLVWHYRKVETGLGEMRTRELTSHLKYISSEKDIQIMEGHKVIEVKNSHVNKGHAAAEWLKDQSYDFHMACGDDWTDEDTFKVMPEEAFTVKVGYSSSSANFRVESYEDIRKILIDLTS
ncbi:trehalose 6-phosphate synthase/phosphatase [Ekhidna lutea]|uniref:Alpha,alpha-trehalose-phosphate synthase n=1 Tax=Ekhidna lutea TaxID=447679 RepID=A0A239KRW6_EKHLU|nr:bifunctional alpha,alpha-trehalose-phosphate synthase (UDP-forming)/trehalose-phosphatase [Ekhidna lutea]SNT20780.1 trehalose 6-phosphate synthase/phosphatase [Ekhidna lutea]